MRKTKKEYYIILSTGWTIYAVAESALEALQIFEKHVRNVTLKDIHINETKEDCNEN